MKSKVLISAIFYVLGGILIFIGSLLKITHHNGDFLLSLGLGINFLFILGLILVVIGYFTGKNRKSKENN